MLCVAPCCCSGICTHGGDKEPHLATVATLGQCLFVHMGDENVYNRLCLCMCISVYVCEYVCVCVFLYMYVSMSVYVYFSIRM